MHSKGRLGWKSIPDAQKHLPLSRSAYYAQFACGKLRSIRIGNSRFVDMDSVEQLIRRAASKGTPRKISEEMRQRGLASAKRREAKQQELKNDTNARTT